MVLTMALFNVRVYGLLFDTHQRLLVSDEFIRGNFFTKLPGGGLEIGEGTRDCLQREFKEETGLDVEIGNHIYTTDFFQISAFNNKDQIIPIYYWVHAKDLAGLILENGSIEVALNKWGGDKTKKIYAKNILAELEKLD